MTFEWDEVKSEWTKRNRGFDFEYASTVFLDPERLESIAYERRGEVRYHTVGKAVFGEILFIVFTWRQHAEEQVCRIISARIAHEKERQRYTGLC